MESFIIFLKKHWSKCILGLLCIACIIAWTERSSTKGRAQTRQDFFVAREIWTQFQQKDELPKESIETLENIVKRHPELHAKYAPLLTSACFSEHNSDLALAHANRAIQQTKIPSFYQQYAHTSLLIAEEKNLEALNEAQTLHDDLQGKEGFEKLFAMNLIRLVFLSEKLEEPEVHQKAWSALQSLPLFPAIQGLFVEGNISLSDYMNSH